MAAEYTVGVKSTGDGLTFEYTIDKDGKPFKSQAGFMSTLAAQDEAYAEVFHAQELDLAKNTRYAKK